jgi:hypothetical protein
VRWECESLLALFVGLDLACIPALGGRRNFISREWHLTHSDSKQLWNSLFAVYFAVVSVESVRKLVYAISAFAAPGEDPKLECFYELHHPIRDRLQVLQQYLAPPRSFSD